MVVERTRGKGATSFAGIAMILVGTLTMVLGVGASVAGATKPNPEHKVTLCHRTDSRTNPYVEITVDVASVLKTHGHDSHNGPIFSPTLPKHTKWGDIIPPFDFGPGEQYAGKNWTSDGQAILANGCVLPETTTTSSSTTTTGPNDTTTSSSTTSTTDTTTSTSTTTSTTDTTTSTSTPTSVTVSSVTGQGGPGTPIGTVAVDPLSSGSGTLPRTGSPMMILISAGLALVVSGIGLTIRKRRWAN